ncbi:MAG: glycosyltransferase [Chromatiales bacterium]|nr:glycosyltransferase [Chromatiales bacterium]
MIDLLIQTTKNEPTPLVGIITRTKDRPLMLDRAMRSVLSQTIDDWQHVIVNDGGAIEPVLTLAKRYEHVYAGRLAVVSIGTSVGMEAASNIGLSNSSSRYVLIHDDDDTLEPAFLAQATRLLSDPPNRLVRGVVSLSTLINEAVDTDQIRPLGRSLYRSLSGCIRIDHIAAVNQFPPIAFLYERSVLNEIGTYDDSLPVLGDWDFNLRFLARYEIAVIEEPLSNYHHRPGSRDARTGNSLFANQPQHRLYDSILRNRYLRSGDATLRAIGQLMADRPSGPTSRPSNARFDAFYRVPGAAATIRWFRRHGMLLRLTRDV